MKKHKQDPELDEWLDSYTVAGADPALADRIMALAAATPQRQTPPHPWARFWGLLHADAVALIVLALLGFWIGSGGYTAPAPVTQAATSGDSYLEKMIFGPVSLKEVSL